MGITSFSFLCFFAVALTLYYILPGNWQWRFLLLLGVVWFAGSAEVAREGAWYVGCYPLLSVGAVWLAAIVVDRAKERWQKRAALICAVLFCVGLLCTLKFFRLPLFAPAGISFYTLTLLGYLFDVYYEIGPMQRNYGKLLLFGCYFPTMISGPILRYREMEGQFFTGHRFDYRQVTFGMQRMLWGFFKKLVIAERMALVANEIFDHYDQYRGICIWVGAVAFTFQLYADFDGCMDIVLGISECFGLRLPENFNAPFLACSIQEYWRRWHITLGNWLKDYLFYPLLRTKFFMDLPKKLKARWGKKRAKQLTTFGAMFILWFTIGYWHGGSATFIIGSGLLHWFYIVSGELLEPFFVRLCAFLHLNRQGRWVRAWGRLRTFLLVTVGLVFFRSPSVTDGLRILGRGLGGFDPKVLADGTLLSLGLDGVEMMIALLCVTVFLVSVAAQQKFSLREWLERRPLLLRWAILYALLFCVILLGKYGPDYSASEFIYQNFKV